MNPTAILTLLSMLTEQNLNLMAEVERLKAQLAEKEDDGEA